MLRMGLHMGLGMESRMELIPRTLRAPHPDHRCRQARRDKQVVSSTIGRSTSKMREQSQLSCSVRIAETHVETAVGRYRRLVRRCLVVARRTTRCMIGVVGLGLVLRVFPVLWMIPVLTAPLGCDVPDPSVLDVDGDGVADELDAFPLDPSEQVDTDGDGVGDNADAFPDDPDESVEATAPYGSSRICTLTNSKSSTSLPRLEA